MGKSVSQKIGSGLIWNFSAHAITRILSLGVGILMARILAPEDFGMVAIAMVVWEMIAILGQFGLGAKLVHQQQNIDEYANSTFWLNVMVSGFIAAVALVVAPYAAGFYNNPISEPIIKILACGFILSSIGSTHATLLSKNMAFKKLSMVDIICTVLKDIIAVGMVLGGCGLWSLVLPDLFVKPVRIIFLWYMVPWRPRLRLGLKYWKDIFTFGKYVFGTTLLRYLNINGDYLIIGKVLGAAPLGLYRFAYNLANWPIKNVVWVCGKVLFPAFSQLQNDIKEMQRLYLKVVETISIILFPCLIGLLATAEIIIPAIYGEKWRPAVLPLKIIIAFTTIRSIASLGGQVLMALGLPNREFKMNAFQVIPLLVAVFWGSRFGIVGVATGMSVVLSGFAIWFIAIAAGAIDLRMKTLGKAVLPAFVSSGIMWICVVQTVKMSLANGVGEILTVLIATGIGALSYIFCMLLIFREPSQRFFLLCRRLFEMTGFSRRFRDRAALKRSKPSV